VDHTPAKGSGRHARGVVVADGSGPVCHLRAVLSLMPAAAAAASKVFLPSACSSARGPACRWPSPPAPASSPSAVKFSAVARPSARQRDPAEV